VAQREGLTQIGQAVTELDRVTQQNASPMQQTAHSASDMRALA
jgi:methyl-accepting chemotaxis protein